MIEVALEDGGQYTVQRAVLCNASEYFRAALLGRFAEARDKKLRLPGCESALFEILLYWICNRELPDLAPETDLLPWGVEKIEESYLTLAGIQEELVRAWHLADMYLMPALQNEIMDRLLDILENCQITALAMSAAFALGSPECILQEMLLQVAICENGKYGDRELGGWDSCENIPGFFSSYLAALWPQLDPTTKREVLRSKYMKPT